MPKLRKWSPIRIPEKFRKSTDSTDDPDPTQSWDPDEWDDPEADGWIDRLTPNHTGQWLILFAIVTFGTGFLFYITSFFPPTSGNPWTLVGTLWPASLAVIYVKGREDGFLANKKLDWTFALDGATLRVFPGKFVERFGEGDHYKFTPLKSRTFGAFRFNWLKLADLEQNREHLISKASGSNRAPDSPARILLPGALTGEASDTVLGRVFGVHSGGLEWHDSGSETDMRFTNPSSLDEEIAGDVLNQLEMYDSRVIPEMRAEIRTVESQKERYKQRAKSERDPELERIFDSLEKISNLMGRTRRPRDSSESSRDEDVEEITERAREQVDG